METFTSIVKTIWLADDDPDDLEIFEETLTEIYPAAHLTTLSSGDELLERLATLPAPDLLFLDINMPCDGHSCLKTIRSQTKYHSLPIVVYSSSFRDKDMILSYQLGANLYIRKPTSYSAMLDTIKTVLQLNWDKPSEITINQLVDGKYVPFTAQ